MDVDAAGVRKFLGIPSHITEKARYGRSQVFLYVVKRNKTKGENARVPSSPWLSRVRSDSRH